MTPALARTRPRNAAGIEHELFLVLVTVAADLSAEVAELLRAANLSTAQYNVLRILRGAGSGLACGEIAERLITRDPDMTRLLDRLETAGLVERTRERSDRRVITVRITDAGLQAVGALDAPVSALHRRQFAHLSSGQMQELLDLLRAVSARTGD